ncbi:MAG: SHOCT domain-containing protein [Spirochaetales bacterium]|nr:SHOCT domain-containing protein [Spirochaetales bacterium]
MYNRMYGLGYGMNAAGPFFGFPWFVWALGALLVAGVVVAIVLSVKANRAAKSGAVREHTADGTASALAALKERLARGELAETEYDRLKAKIEG